MQLYELLKKKSSIKEEKRCRIYCIRIPENKSYNGQTFSHCYSGKYLIKKYITKM